jgi:hypothetical protein
MELMKLAESLEGYFETFFGHTIFQKRFVVKSGGKKSRWTMAEKL